MLWDQVIYWMSHVGEGTWAGFKRAVASLAPAGVNSKDVARLLRLRFSDLAIAEFFIDGSERWQAFGPLLASSPHDPQTALLAGARTPNLIERLRKSAAAAGCQVFELAVEGLFTSVKVHGRELRSVAEAADIEYERDIGRRLALCIPTLDDERGRNQSREPPRNWAVSSFDYDQMIWREGPEHGPAIEMTSKYEERAYFVRARDGGITRLPKRFALYAGAAVQGVELARYDSRTLDLVAPAAAPLPEPCARAACLAGGRASVVRNRRVLYENVPARLAGIILASLEQPAAETFSCVQA
jgi:hypothetical protein